MAFNSIPFHGKKCRIEKDRTKLEYSVDWSINIIMEIAEGSRMGIQWKEGYPGWAEWNGSFRGSFAPGNTEQKAFFDAIMIAPFGKVTDVRFLLDNDCNSFWGDFFISQLSIKVNFNQIVNFKINLKGASAGGSCGPIVLSDLCIE